VGIVIVVHEVPVFVVGHASNHEKAKGEGPKDKDEEVFVVAESDAVVNKWTMVVHF